MISIIIPVYNEENAIAETIHKCQQVIKEIGNADSEIIIVDDASEDKSNFNAQKPGVKVITHTHNLGYGKSLKDGILAASNDTIVITDADGTYPIEMIPTLLKSYNNGNNMSVGKRQWRIYKESLFKVISRKILNKLVTFSTNKAIPDTNSGLRIFSKIEVLPFLSDLCNTFSFTTSLTLAFLMTGKLVEYIPVEYHPRIGKTKVKPIRDSLITLKFIFKSLKRYNPRKLIQLCFVMMIFIGLIGAALSFICSTYIMFWVFNCCAFLSMLFLVFIVFLQKNIKQGLSNK